MNALESQLLEALEKGEAVSVLQLGGWQCLLAIAPELGTSPLVDEFIKIAVMELNKAEDVNTAHGLDFICTCFENATSDIALPVVIDELDKLSELSERIRKRIFVRALAVAEDKSLRSVARGAGVDGALRWALRQDSPASLKHLLTATLVSVDPQDDPVFLSHAARIIGVCYTHLRLYELKTVLGELCKVHGVVQDAAFELALANLEDALCAPDHNQVRSHLETARFWFRTVTLESEQNPAARTYLECIEALSAFEDIRKDGEGADRLASIRRQILELVMYHVSACDASWLGARNTQIMLWASFAERLHQCTYSMTDDSWFEPDLVIREHLLAILSLNRTFIQRDTQGFVRAIVKPRILDSIVTHSWQRGLLQKWMARNQDSDEAVTAKAILEEVEVILSKSSQFAVEQSTSELPSLSELLDKHGLSCGTKEAMLEAALAAQAQYLTSLSATSIGIFENCIEAVRAHHDFAANTNGRSLFGAVLLWTISFLHSRCNMGRMNAPVAYLFEAEREELPKEESLQRDYSQMMTSIVGHDARIEMPDVAGGRADVWFKLGGEHLVVEVKREMSNASFEALERAYSAQAAEYQNTSIRLGIVLVLDLTEVRASGSIHMADLVQARQLIRSGETEPRWLVFVKVPGRRLPPSELKN